MKHSIKRKILSLLLSVLIVMQIVPFSTFAFEETSDIPSYTVSTENGLNETPDILYEVVEKRDMYTKVYKMTDGSFCEIKSFSPVHEFVDGEWIEICSANTDGVETLEEATQILSSGSDSASALFSLSNSEQTVSDEASIRAFSKDEEAEDDRYYETANLEVINEDSAVIVYPEALDAVRGKMRMVVQAQIVMNCELNQFANDEHNYITAYEATKEIEKDYEVIIPETEPEDEPEDPIVIEKFIYDVDNGYGDLIFDNVNIENAGYYIWDITELYNLWERGLSENNGVIFKAFEEAGVKINGGSFSVTYREISPIDENFSYYSFDMGRAGTVYINEFTNEITIVRNDIGIDGNIMPVLISGLYYKNNNMSSEQYGENWSFNYNSSLKKDGYNYVWNMIGGNSLVFYRDIYYDPDTHGGYSKWLDEEKEYTLYIHENSSNNNPKNYSLNYIIDKDGSKYSFDDKVFTEGAYLKSVEMNSNTIAFEYNNGNLQSITDGVGRKYIFTYYEDTNGPDYLSNISVNSLVEGTTNTYEPIVIESYTNEETEVEISYDYTLINDKLYLTTVAYPDGESINYEYSTTGTLISISDIDGRKLTIESLFNGKVYTESVTEENSTQNTLNSLLINDKNTYLRIIEHHDGTYEKTYYNRLLKPQYYQKYTCDRSGLQTIIEERYYEYTNDGITSNLFVPETEEENSFLLNCSFEEKSGRNKPADWDEPVVEYNGSFKRDSSEDHSDGEACLKLVGMYCEEMYVSQEFHPFSKGLNNGDFIAIGGYVMVGEAIVSPSHFCGIKVIAHCAENTEFEVCSIPFDTNIVDEWQYIMSSFEISDSYSGKSLSHYEIRCSFDFQEGYVYFDDLKMYKTERSYDIVIPNGQCSCEDCVYGEGCPCKCESTEQCSCEECKPTVLACGCDENSNWGLGCSCSSENMSGCDCVDNKIVIDEETGLVISDGSKQMMTTKIYDSDNNYLSKTIDENGIEINYTYNPLNGLLESVENANGKTEYYYDAIGTLEKISVAVSNLSDNHTHMVTDYNYVNNKISSITHNGFSYYFFYDENGNYQTVKVGNENLVSYGYDNNQQLNQITYANGDTITYTYDSNGLITEVYLNQSTNPTYQYEYNEFGELIASTDNSSGLTTKYNHTVTNADGTSTTYSVLVHRTEVVDDVRYYKIISDGKVIENITGEEYIQNPTMTNYNCETGITTSSTKTEHGGMSFVTAAATDVFGRRINTPENTSVNNESWNETMSSSNTVLQKDYRDLIVSKAETEYFYDDSDTTAKSLVSGYRNEVSGVSYYHFETSYLPLNVNEKWENSNFNYYYIYNEYGNITEVYSYAEDGVTPDRLVYRYTYDENQNVIREDYSGSNENGAYSHTYTYCYDDNGRVTRRDDFGYTLGELGEDTTPLYFIFNETDQRYYYKQYPYDSKNEYSYEYDGVGNISKVYSGLGEDKSLILSYEYDEANQLVRENNKNLQKTFIYTYDAGGNISSKAEYEYTTDAQISSSAINTINYSYDTIWKDKLISYNNKAITYDELGNPLTYGDKNSISEEYREYEWQGKQLVSCTILNKNNNPDVDVKYVYTYNGEGLRSSRTSYDCDNAGTVDVESAIRTEYLWEDGKLIYLWGSPEFSANEYSDALSIKYLYDENDEPYGMITNGSNVFYFVKNLQGDIERIVTSDCKTRMITYSYDVWGNMTYELNSRDIQTMLGSMLMLANNVVTYRGYTYDFETGLYYLKSRYYSPEWGRFLNADSYCDTETSIIGTNMFAYCDNNPVNYVDPEGFASITINVYSGGVGHADITIGSTTYAFGNYQTETNRWDQITGQAKGYLVVATASEWLKKERTQYSVETFTISVSDSEKKSIEDYCKNVQKKGSWYRHPWNDSKVGSIYRITSGTYSKYSLLTRNCVHFTVQATSSGIRSRLASLSKKVYGDSTKIFSVFLPASFRSFMYQYMANYYCIYKSYSKAK